MRRLLPAVATLLAACAGSRPAPLPRPETTAEAAVRVRQVSVVEAEPPTLLFELTRAPGLPDRLAGQLDAGRSWLSIREPRRYSFAARDLLLGRTLFRPDAAALVFAQERRAEGRAGREPVLVRASGALPTAVIAARVTPVEDPGVTPEGLGALEHRDLRVMLGRGVDRVLAAAGSTSGDVHEWVTVVDGAGARIDWRDALVGAYRARDVTRLERGRVVVKRFRSGARERWFQLPLADVVLAAQMTLNVGPERTAWTWEGVWFGEMRAPPEEVAPPSWTEMPRPRLIYKEYERPRGDLGPFWDALLQPLALGADIGATFIEGEPLLEGVAARRRARGD